MTSLDPAWTYVAAPGRVVLFSGVVDREGNLYLIDAPSSSADASGGLVISLTPEGQERWRTEVPAIESWNSNGFTISVIGESVFVGGWPSYPNILALHSSDGTVAWTTEPGTSAGALASAGPDIAAFLVSDGMESPSMESAVFVDATTGLELARYDDVVTGWPTIALSDGAGLVVFDTLGRDFQADLTAVTLQGGVQWQLASSGTAPAAMDGKRLFLADGQVLLTENGEFITSGLTGDVFLDPARGLELAAPARVGSGFCDASGIQTFSTVSGVRTSECRLEQDGDAFEILASPLLTENGLAFLGKKFPFSLEAPPTLWWIDSTGQTRLTATLQGMTGQNPALFLSPGAIVQGRWIMNAWAQPNVAAVIAYDVPDLALAPHGWISPGGNQQRNSAPW